MRPIYFIQRGGPDAASGHRAEDLFRIAFGVMWIEREERILFKAGRVVPAVPHILGAARLAPSTTPRPM